VARTTARWRRPSLVLLLVLITALVFGAVASLLIGAATSQGAPPSHITEVVFPAWLLADGFLAVVFAVAGFLVYRRITEGAAPVPHRYWVTVLFTILVAILFLVAVRFWAGGVPNTSGGVASPGGNQTGTFSNNSTSTTPTVQGGGGSLWFWSPSLPPWLPFLLVASVILVAVAVAIPLARGYLLDRGGPRGPHAEDATPRVAAAVGGALSHAAEELDRGGDPRAVIVALYGAVLDRLTPIVGRIDPETPEEIRTQHLVRLGIRGSAATNLTRLFEEARYSSHPLGGDAADRARQAVREALSDLARTQAAPP
jgi:hypothetical protein